eukprot:CAMPEP_0194716556 /NCGR_PEP_ID=MMETSP0296-20130528/8264_1 /TAXON_ID=39354 /ORGANISM="Heterosigma akashiwo, Strain CCMP2393" /LENGTH=746 /DNA_ID=CAMNT_0039617005 /DNA_START=273 /DNA_END=2513 /DNA_ORIENTATION=-
MEVMGTSCPLCCQKATSAWLLWILKGSVLFPMLVLLATFVAFVCSLRAAAAAAAVAVGAFSNGCTAFDLAFRNAQIKSVNLINQLRYKGRRPSRGDAPLAVSNFQQVLRFVKIGSRHLPSLCLTNVNLIKPGDFLTYGRIPPYKVCEEEGWHRPADALSTEKRCLFVSHRWEADEEPDPSNTQYEMICSFLNNSSTSYDFLWVDYSCIIQDKQSDLFVKHLQCIPLALYCCTHTLILPKISESPNGEKCTDLKDYLNRGWCQMEALTGMITGTAAHCYFKYGSRINIGSTVTGDDFYDEDLVEGGNVFKASGLYAIQHCIEDAQDKRDIRDEMDDMWFDSSRESADILCGAVDALLRLRSTPGLELVFNRVCRMELTAEDLDRDDLLRDFADDLGALKAEGDRVTIAAILLFTLAYCMAYLPDMPRRGTVELEKEAPRRYTAGLTASIPVFKGSDFLSSQDSDGFQDGRTLTTVPSECSVHYSPPENEDEGSSGGEESTKSVPPGEKEQQSVGGGSGQQGTRSPTALPAQNGQEMETVVEKEDTFFAAGDDAAAPPLVEIPGVNLDGRDVAKEGVSTSPETRDADFLTKAKDPPESLERNNSLGSLDDSDDQTGYPQAAFDNDSPLVLRGGKVVISSKCETPTEIVLIEDRDSSDGDEKGERESAIAKMNRHTTTGSSKKNNPVYGGGEGKNDVTGIGGGRGASREEGQSKKADKFDKPQEVGHITQQVVLTKGGVGKKKKRCAIS